MRQFLLSGWCCLLSVVSIQAQSFDHYLNKVLMKVETSKGATALKKLTPDLITDHDQVIAQSNAALIVVKTNQGRFCKLLVQTAYQKVDENEIIPALNILKFVTYREGTEQERVAQGEKLMLFPGFRLNLDLGQIVPKGLPADLTFTAKPEKATLPVDKAKLFLVTKPMKEALPKKGPKLVVGKNFDPSYFNGKFKLYDDGRRSGVLHLKVEKDLRVSGSYYSARNGKKYEVNGKIGSPQHSIQFRIKLPRTEQYFYGWLFTSDASVLAGHSVMVKREAGFYAVRVKE